MAEERYSTEIHRKIFEEHSEEHSEEFYAIGPDRDGLGLLEVVLHSGLTQKSFVIPAEMAALLGTSIIDCSREMLVPKHEQS